MIRPAALRRAFAGLVLCTAFAAAPAAAQSGEAAALLRRHAEAGTLAEGEKALAAMVAARAGDAEARAALGFAKFARGVEKLGQSLHRYGLRPPLRAGMMMPVVRFPVPENPNPEPVSYEKMRAVYTTLLADLAEVDKAFADLPAGEFKLKVNLFAINLDLDGDGKGSPRESLGGIVQALMEPPARRRPGQLGQPSAPDVPPPWNVAFDRADTVWLRGYAKFLSAFSEFALAHDWRDTFNATGELFFPKVEGGLGLYSLARRSPSPITGGSGAEEGTFADVIAMLHLMRFNVVEPERKKRVRLLLLDMVKLSRENWKAVLAETDDEDEWLPAPKQKNVAISALQVTDAVVNGWLATLDEFEQILEGKLLLGHWRFEKGVDMKQLFEEPRPFDLMLWLTGHAATPYLKDGPTTSTDTLNQWQRLFGGNFLGFAMWFN